MSNKHPLSWIGSLYFMQGLPFMILTFFTSIMYKELGISNAVITFWVSLLTIPWILKPLWAPLLTKLTTKKRLVIITQLISCCLLCLIALVLHNFLLTLVLFFILAISAASYDIVADGLYMLNLNLNAQEKYVGVRTLFYQSAKFYVQGGIVIVVGILSSWTIGLLLLAVSILLLAILHVYTVPEEKSKSITSYRSFIREIRQLPYFSSFCLFIFLYSGAEAQLIRITPLYMLDKTGLALSTTEVGIIYGVVATACLMFGALCGGWLIAKLGLRYLLATTIFATLCNCGYLLLTAMPYTPLYITTIIIALAQFAFGLTNSAFMSFLLATINNKKHQTSIYAALTAIMTLGIIVIGAPSGLIQKLCGYQGFFTWIILFNLAILGFTMFMVKKYDY